MATLKWILDVNSPNAAKTFDQIGARMAELDRSLAKTREITVGDRDAMAKFARLQLAADRFRDRIHGMPLTIEGAARAEAQLLALEATASRAGGGAGGGGAAGLFGAGGTLAPLLSAGGAPGGIGGIAAALAALPFAAQAAAGGNVTALGGGLAAIGVIGAARTREVQKQFHWLSKSASFDLGKISKPFDKVMVSILATAETTLAKLTRPLERVMAIIGPSFKAFGDTLLKSFAQPAVVTSLKDVAKAFGGILKALAPQLPGDIKDIAIGIERIANTVRRNPGAFAAVISFFFKATGFALSMVAALASVANYIERHFIPALMHIRKGWDDARHQTAVILDGMRHQVAHVWDMIFQNTVGTVIRLGHNVETQFNSLRHSAAAIWDTIWNNTVGRVQRGARDVLHWVSAIPGGIRRVFAGAGTWLLAAGRSVITGLLNGLKSVWKTVTSFISGIASWIKAHKGPVALDASLLEPAGKALMSGLLRGLMGGFGPIAGFIGGVAGKIAGLFGFHGGGSTVALGKAMAASIGWTGANWNALFSLWQGESGWNPRARNPSSGAFGIPQALPPGKMGAAAVAGDAAAQIRWGLGYIRSVYGNPLNAYRMWLSRSPHWYGSGTPPGGILFSRPQLIGVGERGPERVEITPAGSRGGHTGPLFTINGGVHIREESDIPATAARLSFLITAASLGS